jgi:hypothetical protein
MWSNLAPAMVKHGANKGLALMLIFRGRIRIPTLPLPAAPGKQDRMDR